MKIAFLVGEFPSLSETFILNQLIDLIDRGHDVFIFSDRPKNTDKFHLDVSKYRLLERTFYYPELPANYLLRLFKWLWLLSSLSLKDPILVIRSLDLLRFKKWVFSLRGLYLIAPFLGRRHEYDVIHCHFGNVGLKGLFLKDVGAIQGRLITSFHGYDVNVLPQQLGKNLYIRLFQNGELFTGGSAFIINKLIELGCPEEKIIKLPVGVNCSDYCFKQRNLEANEPIKIVTVARLTEKKGLEYSIKAVAAVAQNHPNLAYRILGDGHLRESLQQLIRDLGMEAKIQLLGWKTKDEVRELYNDSHIFILSSVTAKNGDKEGQGLVLQEAQAVGLPVLATLHNGFPDSVLDGQSAFLVPERDVDALAAQLNFLIEHPEKWARMGGAGRKLVEACFDIKKLGDQLVDVYQKLLKE